MKKRVILLLVFIIGLYILPAVFRPLAAPEEFRCAEIAREMLESGNFQVPKVIGARFFDQMPMTYWLTAASFKCFGVHAFSMRFVSILATLLSALLLAWWSVKQSRSEQTAVNTAFLFLSGSVVCFFGSWSPLHSLSAMWVIAAWVFSAAALDSDSLKKRLIYLAASGIAMGCGFLTKGISAILLPEITVILTLIWQRRWKECFAAAGLPLLTALLTLLPWSLIIHHCEPDFWNYRISSIAGTFSGGNSARYTLAILLMLLGVLPGVLPVFFGSAAIKNEIRPQLRNDAGLLFAVCSMTVAAVFAILSAPAEKFIPYVLPFFGASAAAGSLLLAKADQAKLYGILRNLTSMCSILFIIAGSLLLLAELFYLLWGTGFIPVLPLKYAVWAPFITTTALGMVIAGTAMFVNRNMKFPEPESFFMLFAITALVCVWFYPGFTANHRMPEYELLEAGSKLSEKSSTRPRIITTPRLMYSTAWCFRDSSIQLLGSCGEMYYGHRSALKNSERPLMLTFAETGVLLKKPERKEDILILMLKEETGKFRQYLPAGKKMNTSGEICALYYPGYPAGAKKK